MIRINLILFKEIIKFKSWTLKFIFYREKGNKKGINIGNNFRNIIYDNYFYYLVGILNFKLIMSF